MMLTAILLGAASLVSAQHVLSFNCQNAPNVCNNMCYHYRCIDTNHIELTYDADANARSGRRRDSGCQSGARNPCRGSWGASGNSCDEMPFASTNEGGTGATLRCVPGPENSSQGGQLSNFYRPLADGDRFRIAIYNENNSPLCTQQGCANDGHEFKLTPNGHNGYILARDAEARKDNAFKELATEKKGPAQKMRKFKDDKGQIHSLLLGDGTLVGQSVWTEDGERKIVSEVGSDSNKDSVKDDNGDNQLSESKSSKKTNDDKDSSESKKNKKHGGKKDSSKSKKGKNEDADTDEDGDGNNGHKDE